MWSSLFVAVLAASLAGAQGAAWRTGGSTAAEAAIEDVFKQGKAIKVSGLLGNTISYASIGSGAGIDAVLADKLVSSFSDVARPRSDTKGLEGFPVAIGSISIFINANTPGFSRRRTVLSTAALCRIFDNRIVKPFPWSSVPGKPVGDNPKNVRVAVRTDSSGSTAVVAGYLKRACGAGFVFIKPSNPRAFSLAGQCDGTSGELKCIGAKPNVVGYAVCGSTACFVAEVAIENQKGTVVKCEPEDGYTGIRVEPPKSKDACRADWTGVVIRNKSRKAYPLAFLLYTYIDPKTSLPPVQLNIAEDFYNFILTGPSRLTDNFFYPLPRKIRELSNCCADGLPQAFACPSS